MTSLFSILTKKSTNCPVLYITHIYSGEKDKCSVLVHQKLYNKTVRTQYNDKSAGISDK